MVDFPARVEAQVLAGGGFPGLPQGERCPPGKGLVPVGELPMAARAFRAVKASPRVLCVTLVSPVPREELHQADWPGLDRLARTGNTIMESFANGLRRAEFPREPVLSVTGDLPFLTPECVTDFVDRCAGRPDHDLWCGFLRREVSQVAYPRVRHTWARLAEGVYCGTGLYMIRPVVLDQVGHALQSAARHRKNPLRLAGLLGWGTVLAFLLQRLTVTRAEQAVSRVLGVRCAGIETPYPESAFNVDDLPTLLEARRLAARVPSASLEVTPCREA